MEEFRYRAQDDWPPVEEALVRALRLKYPPKCIGPDESAEEAHRYAGKVELIETLAAVHENQRNPQGEEA